jgi:hypothetical protein
MSDADTSADPPGACEQLRDAVRDPDVPLDYNDRFREYGIRILDGGSAHLNITHCPWCAEALPPSLRDEWFDAIEEMGLRAGDPAIPEEYLSGAWWRAGEGH